MESDPFVWNFLFVLLMISGICLGILGALFFIYVRVGGRGNSLRTSLWIGSTSFVYATVMLATMLTTVLLQQFPPALVEYSIVSWFFLSYSGLFGQCLHNSPNNTSSSLRLSRLIFLLDLLLCNVFPLVGFGFVYTQGSGWWFAALFALPGTVVIGVLNGFARPIQRWFFHLPGISLAVIGIVILLCACGVEGLSLATHFHWLGRI